MIKTNRLKAVLYLVLVSVGILILAASMGNFELQPGLPFPGADPDPTSPDRVQAVDGGNSPLLPWLLQGSLALVFVVLLLFLIANLVKEANLKRIAQLAGGLALVLLLVYLLPKTVPGLPEAPPAELSAEEGAVLFSYETSPIGDPPNMLVWMAAAGLLLVLAVAGAWLLRRALSRPLNADPLAREAEAALQAIHAGQDLVNVILRCYLQMSQALQDEQGIEREAYVTPREFEKLLAERGVPREPVRRLTGLFEKVRYGSKTPVQQDEQAAVECLTAIRAYCQSRR